VFHTRYAGDTFKTMDAQFGVDVAGFGEDNNVWYDDAYIKDMSGSLFSSQEVLDLKTKIKQLDALVEQVPMPLWMKLSTNKDFTTYMLQFINKLVRGNKLGMRGKDMMQQFLNYYRDVQQQAKDKLKTDKAKDKRDEMVALMGKLFSENARGVENILEIHNRTILLKTAILKQINQIKATKQFIKTDQGYQVTNPEGYVAIDNDGQAVKLVDRLDFSKANLTAQKQWASES